MLPAAASWMARSVMNLAPGRPVVVSAVRVQVAPVLSSRETTCDVAAKSRVPLANSIDWTAPPSASCVVLGGASVYGLVLVGSVVQVVPQSVVSQTRLVPNAASEDMTPAGVAVSGA